MTDKEAIETLKDDEMYITDSFYREFRTTIADKYTKAFEIILNLIQTQQEEIEERNRALDIVNREKADLLEEIETCKDMKEIANLEIREILSWKNEIKRLNAELEKKDNYIEEMATYIGNIDVSEDLCNDDICDEGNNCNKCIKEYFINKVEKENKDE